MRMLLDREMRAVPKAYGAEEIYKCRVTICFCIVENALNSGCVRETFCCRAFDFDRRSKLRLPFCEREFDAVGCALDLCSEDRCFAGVSRCYRGFEQGFQ